MSDCHDYRSFQSRREFLAKSAMGLGAMALGSLMNPLKAFGTTPAISGGGILGNPHFAPKAKRIIYMFQSGAPSQIDLFDPKPLLRKMNGEELPASIRGEQRLTGMTSGQKSFPCVAPMFNFRKYGEHQTYVSELLPHISGIVDEIAIVKTMNTEAIFICVNGNGAATHLGCTAENTYSDFAAICGK